jgi:hypothetical protein
MDELLAYLFDGQSHLLAAPMAAWLASSRRFAAFAHTFRDKIRKKLRVTHEPEALFDLRLELETAYLLLGEPPLSLEYEPKQSELIRSPDFAVTFTTRFTFMVEVARLRATHGTAHIEADKSTVSMAVLVNEQMADTICSKLGQLLPQRGNVVVVGLDGQRLRNTDPSRTMVEIQRRVEHNDEAFLRRHRFRDRADFFRQYQRLSEVLIRGSQLSVGVPPVVWVNPQAKYPLPRKVQTVLYHSHTG